MSQVAAYGGGTGISVPLPLRSLGLPPYLELGLIYKVCLPQQQVLPHARDDHATPVPEHLLQLSAHAGWIVILCNAL